MLNNEQMSDSKEIKQTKQTKQTRHDRNKEYCMYQEVTETTRSDSPCGNYYAMITSYRRGWTYTGAVVYDSNNAQIGEIYRNYSGDHKWIVNTKTSKTWFFMGTTYQSQTFIDCCTGNKYDNTEDPDHDTWCWAKIDVSPDGRTAVVEGCYWAAGYNRRFYDVSDPSCGWELMFETGIIGDGEYIEWEDNVCTLTYSDSVVEYENKLYTEYCYSIHCIRKDKEKREKIKRIQGDYDVSKLYMDSPEDLKDIEEHPEEYMETLISKFVYERVDDKIISKSSFCRDDINIW